MSFLQDVHPEVTDALLGFLYDPLDASYVALDAFLNPLPNTNRTRGEFTTDPVARAASEALSDCTQYYAKRPRGCNDLYYVDNNAQALRGGQVPMVLPELLSEFALPPPPVFGSPADNGVRKAGRACQSAQSAAARERRKRISEKTQELAQLIPGGHKLNTAEMLHEAARHVKFLQAQVGVLALMHAIEELKVPSMVQEQMEALLGSGNVQERLSGEGKCLVPKQLVGVMAKDREIKSNAPVTRDLNRFLESLG